MALTLHEAFVPYAKQILGGMKGLIDKAEAHCAEHGIDASELIEAKLADTMWTLPWHVRACWVHSGFAIGLYPSGAFSPDFTELPGDWDAMRAMVDDALAQLRRAYPTEIARKSDFPVAEAGDYPRGEGDGYAAIRREYIEPIEQAYDLCLRISTAIANQFGAHG